MTKADIVAKVAEEINVSQAAAVSEKAATVKSGAKKPATKAKKK